MKTKTLLANIVFLFGCQNKTSFDMEKYLRENTTAPELSGRFQLQQLGSFRRDQFIIDTVTGKLWRAFCSTPSNQKYVTDCADIGWAPEQTIDLRDVSNWKSKSTPVGK